MRSRIVLYLVLACIALGIIIPSTSLVTQARLPTIRQTAAPVALPTLAEPTAVAIQPTPVPFVGSLPIQQSPSMLRLLTFAAPPTNDDLADVQRANMTPLSFVPPAAYIVRVQNPDVQTVPAEIRNGLTLEPYTSNGKISRRLSVSLQNDATTMRDIYVLLASDADVSLFQASIQAAGLQERARYSGVHGTSLVLRGPGSAVTSLAQYDQVLWLSVMDAPEVQNDTARAIIGQPVSQRALDLTGQGQIIAITDSGLDDQNNLSADFAGRLVRAFGPRDMDSSCRSTDWSDYNGHGTHVAGSALGSGTLSPSGSAFGGIAPRAGLVMQSVRDDTNASSGKLGCLPATANFLALGYAAGARIHSASFNFSTEVAGTYTAFDYELDSFLWKNKDYVLIVSAGNTGADADKNGVVDRQSVISPATAKNTISVGASENARPPITGASCTTQTPENCTWRSTRYPVDPIASDLQSNNPNGLAPFSARGPTRDGRIKPTLVAPGTNIASARSHARVNNAPVPYRQPLDTNYAFLSGTSMATPITAGSVALIREWVMRPKSDGTLYDANPSAALLTALLINGTTPLTIGQYGEGTAREMPPEWPNIVAGWGRLQVANAVGAYSTLLGWDEDNGLITGGQRSYQLNLASGQAVRLALAWTDAPFSPVADGNARTLINDLDMHVIGPDGRIITIGNANAQLPATCRDVQTNADRCNNAESATFTAVDTGTYTLVINGRYVMPGVTQPFALVADTTAYSDAPAKPPTVQYDEATNTLNWDAVQRGIAYEVIEATNAGTAASPLIALSRGTSVQLGAAPQNPLVVRACNRFGCGPTSAPVTVNAANGPDTIVGALNDDGSIPPGTLYLPLVMR